MSPTTKAPAVCRALAFGALGLAVLPACSSSTPTALSGLFYGPTGTQVTLQVNGGDDLQATVVSSAQPAPYDKTPFKFATPLAAGSQYSVTVTAPPANQRCDVFAGAQGVMPVADGVLRVGCEYVFDSVARSTDDKTVATYYESQSAVIGGANVGIGQNPRAYGEGRFVAFVSSAKLAGSTGAHRQVFMRDRLTAEVYLVSASSSGVEGNGDSENPAISADGLTVAFESAATNLVDGDGNGVKDVFVWDIHSIARLSRVSVSDDGTPFTGSSGMASLNGDGTIVAFETRQTNITTQGDGGMAVVVRNLTTNTTLLVSKNSMSKAVDSYAPVLSEDGTLLVFYSYQSSLVDGDTNGRWDLFLYDILTQKMKRVSLTWNGAERDQGNESSSRLVAPAISGDGHYVAYATTATNVVANDTNNLQDVFIVNTQTNAVTRASVSTAGAQGDTDSPIGQGERVALSYDGTWVAFSSTSNTLGVATTTTGLGNVFLHNRVTGETRAITNNTTCCSVGPVAMSRDGAYVVFGSSATLDPRFQGSGQFAGFTGLGRPFWWLTE